MAGLRAAAEETKRFILNAWSEHTPERIIFYADNTAAITKIFEGAHGKAQQHSKGFRRAIGSILCNNTETKIAISWCPGHSGIIGNEEADKLAKSASLQNPTNPNYKTQAYVGALHKRELLEEWRFRWMNTPNPPQSGFHPANRIPPTLKTTERFNQTDRRTFSRLVQCRTGHAHIGEYYKKFVPTESMGCTCGTTVQTREHVIKQCKNHTRHRPVLGHGRHAQIGRLMGTVKGIRKLSTFIKRSGAFDKDNNYMTHERERKRRGEQHIRTHQTTPTRPHNPED